MLTEEESIKTCPKCFRMRSLARNITEAWNTQHESIDGYRKLQFAIRALETENPSAE